MHLRADVSGSLQTSAGNELITCELCLQSFFSPSEQLQKKRRKLRLENLWKA